MRKPLQHLLLVTTEDAYNPRAWSGTPFGLRAALEPLVDRLTVFQPPPPARTPVDVAKRVLFGARKFPLWITRATLRQTARAVQSEIDRCRPDAVLSISSQCVAYLEHPGLPTFMFSDAPYQAFCETYRRWETPPLRIAAFAAEEASAARRMDGLCFGSDWACDRARALYQLGPDSETKLHVTPLGATWVPQISRDEVLRRVDLRIERFSATGEIVLLYVGKDWERKGGPLAVEVATHLHQSGHNVTLHIVGCRPELGAIAEPGGFVHIHGLLYQTDPAQSATLAELFLSAHFLIVPTLAECYGIVFAEAQAFALPPVSRAVDALPTVVADGLTGLLFPVDAGPALYAERMLAVLSKPERYRAMALQARERFEHKLTWGRTAESIVDAITSSPPLVKPHIS